MFKVNDTVSHHLDKAQKAWEGHFDAPSAKPFEVAGRVLSASLQSAGDTAYFVGLTVVKLITLHPIDCAKALLKTVASVVNFVVLLIASPLTFFCPPLLYCLRNDKIEVNEALTSAVNKGMVFDTDKERPVTPTPGSRKPEYFFSHDDFNLEIDGDRIKNKAIESFQADLPRMQYTYTYVTRDGAIEERTYYKGYEHKGGAAEIYRNIKATVRHSDPSLSDQEVMRRTLILLTNSSQSGSGASGVEIHQKAAAEGYMIPLARGSGYISRLKYDPSTKKFEIKTVSRKEYVQDSENTDASSRIYKAEKKHTALFSKAPTTRTRLIS
ncbi:MAG: hypothetical protein P0S95_07005 [Rhabdochlamydiaceae bacterium]|nr:hypothetical protein [Candidatus Amphrikana amoebophyrae]